MICLTPIAFNRDPKPEKAVSRSEIKMRGKGLVCPKQSLGVVAMLFVMFFYMAFMNVLSFQFLPMEYDSVSFASAMVSGLSAYPFATYIVRITKGVLHAV
jgi:hypothetical protein